MYQLALLVDPSAGESQLMLNVASRAHAMCLKQLLSSNSSSSGRPAGWQEHLSWRHWWIQELVRVHQQQ
jgi:hypothetical protein